MGAFGMMAPRLPLATAFFGDPAPSDLGATSQGPAFAPQNKPPAGPAPRQGLFGGIRAWLTPERIALIGAGLRQAGGVNGALDQTLQRQMEATTAASQAAWQRSQQDHQQAQWKQDDRQTQDTDAFIASLPVEMQQIARIPGGLEAVMRQMAPTQWQHFYGRAGRINPDGSTTLGGRIPEAPRAQVSMFGNGTDGSTFTPNPAGVAPPAVGAVEEGYRYNGGDPAEPSSWSQVQ